MPEGSIVKHILAVDDDKTMTEYYMALLEEAGYLVRTAGDATAAVMEFRDFKPDLVILDAEMPAGGGEKVFEITREVIESGVPVIFVTGLPQRVEHLVVKNPKTRVFQKPVKEEVLLYTISEMLE